VRFRQLATNLAVSELYGIVPQGEGPTLGEPRMFLRLAGCNLQCTWCDSGFSWDWKGKIGKAYDPKVEMHPMTVEQVLGSLLAVDWRGVQPGLVLTGGEPLLQQKTLWGLISELHERDWYIEIETNGTVRPTWPAAASFVSQYNVSPKLKSSGNPLASRLNIDALKWFVNRAHRAVFKFVCTSEADLAEVDSFRAAIPIPPDRVYIMPEGTSAAGLIQKGARLLPSVVARRYNMTTRLHILLSGNMRGT
jgi:7-carboxy-7-deazaguanine synthase